MGLGKRLTERTRERLLRPDRTSLECQARNVRCDSRQEQGISQFNNEPSDAVVIMTAVLMLGRLHGMRNAGSEVHWETRRSPGQEGGSWWEGKETDKEKEVPGWSRGFEDSLG